MNVAGTLRRIVWTVVLVLGTVAFGAALVPGIGTTLPVRWAVSRLGNDYVLLAVFGAVAVGILLWMLLRRATERIEQASPPEPETVPDTPRPGDWLDETLDQWPQTLAEADRERLRTRLRTTAIRAERRAGASPETARQRVTTGAWTDTPAAAAFLNPDASDPSIDQRLSVCMRGDSWTQFGARAAAAELAAGSEGE